MTIPRPRRILIIGINYAPERSGTAPYTTGAAEYLAAEGDDVQVLTGVPHYPHWSVPSEFRRRLSHRERREGVDVHRLRHFVPASQSAVKRGLYELTFAAHVLAHRHIRKPDVVVAVVPTLLSAESAACIAARSNAKLVVWIQDLMGAAASQSGIAGGRAAARLVSRIEGRVIRQAQTVVVISESFRAGIEASGADPDKIVLIRNWSHVTPPRANRASTRLRLGWGEDEIVALHAGNMGLKQGLDNVVKAGLLAEEGSSSVRFVLMGDGNQRKLLQLQAHGATRVEFLPPVPSDDFGNVLAAADVLLINEAESVFDMSLPSKLTSYLVAGRPVVAAVSALGATAREVERTGAGLVVESGRPDLLLQEVLAIGADPEAATARGGLGLEYAERMLSSQASLQALSAALEPSSLSRPG